MFTGYSRYAIETTTTLVVAIVGVLLVLDVSGAVDISHDEAYGIF